MSTQDRNFGRSAVFFRLLFNCYSKWRGRAGNTALDLLLWRVILGGVYLLLPLFIPDCYSKGRSAVSPLQVTLSSCPLEFASWIKHLLINLFQVRANKVSSSNICQCWIKFWVSIQQIHVDVKALPCEVAHRFRCWYKFVLWIASSWPTP